jgi:HAMP domain-containing protein
LRSLDESVRQLVQLTEAARAAPAPAAATGAAPIAGQAVTHLRNLEDSMRQLVTLTEALRPSGLDEASRRHLASIDAALQRLAALGAVAASAANGGGQVIDGAAIAHLASIEQHLQHIAREAGQLQHRVAQEVRGELRSLAQSIAAMAQEPPASPEP